MAFVALVSAAALAGCRTMAPAYVAPALPVAETFPDAGTETGRAAADVPWRELFGDDRLRHIVELALTNNRDLRAAVLNIERARALYRIQRADLLPTVTAGAGVAVQRTPEGVNGAPVGATADQYSASVGVSGYELDLFGRIRSLNARALQAYLATEQARRSVQISLVSEAAQAYLTLAADQELLQLAQDTLVNQRAALELTRQRLEAGVTNVLALRQAQTSVEIARGDVARYTSLTAQDRNALTLIVGAPVPATLLPEGPLERVGVLADLPAGVPSEVLRRRPDILAAEHQLRGAYANIGAARAQLFPTIRLTASGGVASAALSGLFAAGSGAWSFAPQIAMPIFDAGRNRANVKVAEVDRDLAIAAYEQAIQAAFREVADALAERSTLDDRLSAQQALVDATSDSYRLSDARFKGGVDSYLAVLDSQRALYGAQQGLIGVRLTRIANLVTLYRTLGGGWTETGAQASAATVAGRP
jgi:multidrug efflux system outer membrane protein